MTCPLMRRLFVSAFFTLLVTGGITAEVRFPTIRSDGQGRDAYLAETRLTVMNVNVSEFGKLYSYRVDGPVKTQPVHVGGVTIGGVSRNVLYVATINHKLYAFDADRESTRPLWVRDFAATASVDRVPMLDGAGDGEPGAPGDLRRPPMFWDSPTDGPLAYLWSSNDVLKAYRVNGRRILAPPYMQGEVFSSRGASFMLSANGGSHGTGIVWASTLSEHGPDAEPADTLRAFDAESLREIWTTEQNAARDRPGRLPQFVSPVVASGKLYMPTLDGTVVVYGLLPTVAAGAPGATRESISMSSADSAVSALAEAGTISISFVGTSPALMSAAETAGIIPKANWNNATGAARPTALALVDETGVQTNAVVTWASNNGWMTPIADQPGNARLMKGYLDTTSTSTTTVTVTGLSPRSYDVYVYVDGDNGVTERSAAYTISGAGITTKTINLTDAANTNFCGTFTSTDNSNGNYVRFSISGSAFTLTATPNLSTLRTRRAPVNGIQIVPAPPTTAPRAISIRFAGTSTTLMAAGESAGVVPKTHWNNAAGAARSTGLFLVDDAGMPTTASVTWTANNDWMTPIADHPGNARLMKGYLDTSSTSVTTVSVAGLPSASYDIYVYADGDNRQDPRSASYRITGTGITATTMNLTDPANANFSGSFTQSTGGTGNYLKSTIAGTGFTLTATPGPSTTATRRAPVNAIQIVPASQGPPVVLDPPLTVPDIGAGQGIEMRDSKVYLYGDASTGIVREYDVVGNNAVSFTGRQVRLTAAGRDLVSHPTGLTVAPGIGTFMGDTVSGQGTIFMIDWALALANGTLDGAVQARIVDDVAANGSRPEFVRVAGRWLIATADYGDVANEVRLYDPERLKTATRTSEPGVLVYRFRSSPFVQTLHWIDAAGLLVLVQNLQSGSGWRLTVVDLARSIAAGQEVVTQRIDLSPRDELEGFHLLTPQRGLFLTSSPATNLYFATTRLF